MVYWVGMVHSASQYPTILFVVYVRHTRYRPPTHCDCAQCPQLWLLCFTTIYAYPSCTALRESGRSHTSLSLDETRFVFFGPVGVPTLS
jgi:hypothetical protein